MKFGLLGEKLGHSFSKTIHNALADYDYQLIEVKKEDFPAFMTAKDFNAINVTIPYKQMVIPYLSYIDPVAEKIGAVNTIVNRNGALYGYNTDFYGMTSLIKKEGIIVKGKKVAILGTGGTSKTAHAVMESLGASEIYKVSRKTQDNAVTYQELYEKHSDVEIIVNTTPCGMYPNNYESAIEIDKFNNLEGVIDAIYNPLSSALIVSAKNRGIKAAGGLYMLVGQAVRASEIFLDTVYPPTTLEEIYNGLLKQKQNIVLIGMPASGKSTVGKLLAKKLNRNFVDTDEVIVKNANLSIPEIFKNGGEKAFRDLESIAVKESTKNTCQIIATGGGAVLRKENVDALKQNGKIYFIDRPLSKLIPTDDRPLSSNKADIEKRYYERYEIYKSSCDVIIDADCGIEQVVEKILGDFNK
ncbi:MAG: shikimate dehydrogenase [Clostridia bacterium]|nr:shikimate dehydrogenase [Clostridia bacterium]